MLKPPECFPNEHMWDQWRRYAKASHDDSNPCDDCTQNYKAKQGAKCKESEVRVVYMVQGRATVARLHAERRKAESGK